MTAIWDWSSSKSLSKWWSILSFVLLFEHSYVRIYVIHLDFHISIIIFCFFLLLLLLLSFLFLSFLSSSSSTLFIGKLAKSLLGFTYWFIFLWRTCEIMNSTRYRKILLWMLLLFVLCDWFNIAVSLVLLFINIGCLWNHHILNVFDLAWWLLVWAWMGWWRSWLNSWITGVIMHPPFERLFSLLLVSIRVEIRFKLGTSNCVSWWNIANLPRVTLIRHIIVSIVGSLRRRFNSWIWVISIDLAIPAEHIATTLMFLMVSCAWQILNC